VFSASVLTFLPACDCLTTNALLQLSTLNWLTPVQSSKLLLVLASTVVLGFVPHRDPWQYFSSFRTFMCFEMGPPFRRDEGSGYFCSPPPSTGQSNWLSLTVLLITFRHGPPRKHRSSVAVSNCCCAEMLVCEAVTQLQLLYSCFFRGRCLATGLYAIIFTIVRSVYTYSICALSLVKSISNFQLRMCKIFTVLRLYNIHDNNTFIYNTKLLSVQTLCSRLCLILLSIAITKAYWLEGL
jgi:hypothetical protein